MSENASIDHVEISSEQNRRIPNAVYYRTRQRRSFATSRDCSATLRKLAQYRLCYAANYVRKVSGPKENLDSLSEHLLTTITRDVAELAVT